MTDLGIERQLIGVFMKFGYNGLGKIYKGWFSSAFVSKISAEVLSGFLKDLCPQAAL